MKRLHISTLIRIAALSASLLLLLPERSVAQSYEPVPVTISKEKVKIDGKICYSHVVQERQTLYSISKAYNVNIEDIYRFNPTLKETGLKKNGIILIPSAEATAVTEAPATEAPTKDVQTKETQPKKTQIKESKRKVHTVQWFEDLDVIAEKYGVSVEAIMKLNNLESRKLSKRQKLQIPEQDEIQQTEQETPVNDIVDTSVPASADSTTITETVLADDQPMTSGKEVKAALLLPLNATGTSSHKGNMDFYSGVLLAVSDLANKGVSIDLKVCDTGSNGLPSERYIGDRDFIIGPIAAADITGVLDMSVDGPYIISPLDPRAQTLANSNSRLIQAPTPHNMQYKNLIEWVKEDAGDSDKVILITEKGARQTDLLTQMQTAIDTLGVPL